MRPRLAAGAALLGIAVGASVGIGSAASLQLGSQTLTPYRTCTLTATPAASVVVIDASVRQASPTSNFGTATTVEVASASGANRRAYLRFDLSSCNPAIPSTAIVRLATLRLYLTGVPAACRVLDIFANTTTWSEAGITWNNQPPGTSINNPPSGSRSGSFNVGTPAGCQNQVAGYVTGATVTSDVANFVAGTSTNFGWMIRDDAEGSSTTRTTTFSAKNSGTTARAPQLVITYVVVP